MFGISGEHFLILGVVLLIFGPKRLPELGNTLGKAIRNFKDAIGGVEEAKFRRLEDEKKPVAPSLAQTSTGQTQASAPEATQTASASAADPKTPNAGT